MHYSNFRLDRIRETLDKVKDGFDHINERISARRERLTDEMVDNMIRAYEYLNGLLAKGIELFSPAGLYSMLELNHIVLCGTDAKRRREFFVHIQETRKSFQAGIPDIMDWYRSTGRGLSPFKRATIFYIRTLSQPQLFLEGNHRTGNIILNYMLFTEDLPPFILSLENALEYFDPSTKIKFSSKKNLLYSLNPLPGYEKEFRRLLEKYVDSAYVV